MKLSHPLSALIFLLIFCCSLPVVAQDEEEEPEPVPNTKKSKLLTGFYIGSYFANKYSASTYNGYGFDVDGNRNSFLNSFMYQKIKNEYGGGYGYHDQIADELGVDQGRWEFNESDMPINMRYTPAILVGFNFKIPVSKTSAVIANVNGTKLSIEGNFTITKLNPNTPNPAANTNIQTFAIHGNEQRLQFELGYQKVLGHDDKLNFFFEAGFIGTLAKFDKNIIYINNLQIDLTYYANNANFYLSPGPTKRPVGFGIGAFAGFGLNIDVNPKFTVQLLYTPSQEKINIGTSPTLKLQNALGFRVYYNIK